MESECLGTIHVLRNQDFGFSAPFQFVIIFSVEHNQKLQFSDPLDLVQGISEQSVKSNSALVRI